jgi:hypothetical protein
VHCFAHQLQLQLALVACAKAHKGVGGFLYSVFFFWFFQHNLICGVFNFSHTGILSLNPPLGHSPLKVPFFFIGIHTYF